MVDEVRIDGILQIAALVVREQDVDGLGASVAAVGAEFGAGFGGDGVVDGVDDVGLGSEELVGFDFFQGLRDGFLAEWAADFFEGEESGGGFVLDEVDIGEAALQVVSRGS